MIGFFQRFFKICYGKFFPTHTSHLLKIRPENPWSALVPENHFQNNSIITRITSLDQRMERGKSRRDKTPQDCTHEVPGKTYQSEYICLAMDDDLVLEDLIGLNFPGMS